MDGARNLITIAGTRAELENYLRTIQVFDVDWMSSMSVGVFPLQSGKATDVVQDLERVFGEQGKTPVAGMFRFMPLETTNSVMVVLAQPVIWMKSTSGSTASKVAAAMAGCSPTN